MLKDPTRDYIVAAFRTYAYLGKPTYQEAEAKIYQEALEKFEYKNPEEAVVDIEAFMKKEKSKLDDIAAVNQMIEELKSKNQYDVINAVENIYFYAPESKLRRNDITNRVRKFAQDCPASEGSVYNWLKYARTICAEKRGLYIED